MCARDEDEGERDEGEHRRRGNGLQLKMPWVGMTGGRGYGQNDVVGTCMWSPRKAMSLWGRGGRV